MKLGWGMWSLEQGLTTEPQLPGSPPAPGLVPPCGAR